MKRILLASDGSEHALRTTKKAVELASLVPDSVITVIYVVDSDQSKTDVLANQNLVQVDAKREERLKVTEEMLTEAGVDYKVEIKKGEPGPTIIKYANQEEFDVLIIGSRGLNRFQEFVLGSVSHNVAKHAHCPVMIVK
ncbi:universal stress protein [Halalkalibacillus halophilus]|uniref:universal stress protein n=1 Tax=Halalkalibacillus halophilus TaxID=392827 RepID=UPI0004048246|nr:universal stress protein [Halalkalibacillus halophilus]